MKSFGDTIGTAILLYAAYVAVKGYYSLGKSIYESIKK